MLPSVDGPGVATMRRSPRAHGSPQLWEASVGSGIAGIACVLFAQEMRSQEGACACPLLSVPGSRAGEAAEAEPQYCLLKP